MIYESIDEIFASIDESRSRLLACAENLRGDEASARAGDDGWTVSEILEHVSIIEGQLTKLIGMMLSKAETAGKPAPAGLRIKPVSIEHFVERSHHEKYQAPDNTRPRGGVSVADSITIMRRTREALRALRPRLEATDLTGVRYPHPAFGPLNLYEWLILIGVHEQRHLGQIETVLMQSSSARKGGE
ncbi:MAG: DinB family protein [Pyrinomonadaceae bacterium]|nr:DinB family protein [Pyrinomonadaceae bacterium]